MTFNAFSTPRFERGVGEWAGNGVFGNAVPGEIGVNDDLAWIGTRSGRIDWNPPGEPGQEGNVSAPFKTGDYPNQTWTFLARVYVPAGSPDIEVGFTYVGGWQQVTAKDTWIEVRQEAVIRDVEEEWLSVQTVGDSAEGTAYIDAILTTPGSYAGAYFDGATAGAHWLGRPFLSPSTTEPIPEPDLAVEIAWTGAYGEVSPAWTDITEYVEEIRTQHGRPTELGSIQAGVLTVFLDNTEGHFTAGNEDSPFYPNVRPQRQVRFRTKNPIGVWQNVAHGTVERWPTQYDGLSSEVQVTCTDTLDWLDRLELSPAFEYELNATDPEDVWPMDQDDTELVPSQVHPWRNVSPTKTQLWDQVDYNAGKVESGAANLIPYGAEGKTSFKLSGAKRKSANGYTGIDCGYCLRIQGPEETEWDLPNDSFTAMGYFKIDSLSDPEDEPIALMIARQGAGDSYLPLHFFMEIRWSITFDAWLFRAYQKQNPGDTQHTELFNLYMPTGGETVNMTDPVHLGFAWDADRQEAWSFLNGNVGGPYTLAEPARYWARRVFRMHAQGYTFPHGESGGLFNGKTQYLARWNRKLSTSEIQAIYNAGQGRIDETADERINYILDQAGWPSAKRKIGKSTTRVERAAFTEGQSALEVARKVANDALGLLYVDGDGDIVFEPRHDRAKDDGAWMLDENNGTDVESGLLFEQATEDIVNVADVDNAFGVKSRVVNEASRDEFGERKKTIEIRVTDQDEAIQNGYHFVNRYGEPHTRVSGVEVNASAAANGSLWPFVTSLNLSDRVRIGSLPDTAPAAALDFFVESIRHEIRRDGDRLKWSTALDVSPASLRDAWVLGDFDRSRLGSTTLPHF